jgi:hypothetical protein
MLPRPVVASARSSFQPFRKPAGKIAGGEAVEVKRFRRRGLQRMLITVAELQGPEGTIAVGVVLLALVLGWATTRIVRRPKRTVWLPAKGV